MTGVPALAAYARFQARDALWRALMPVGLFALLAGLPIANLAARNSLAALRGPGQMHDVVMQVYGQTMPLAMTLGAIVLVHGLVALDRERQYFRFPFAQPVVPWQYYLQQFAVGTVLFVACFAVIPLAFGLVVTEVPVLPVLRSALLYALLYGSLAMLTGSLLNRDAVLFILLVIVGNVLQQLERAAALSGVVAGIARALPPFVAADAVRSTWLEGRAPDGHDLTLVVGYSLGMLAAALLLIRHRPLAR
jgi:hypothetical protein